MRGANGIEMPSTEVFAIMLTPSGAFICAEKNGLTPPVRTRAPCASIHSKNAWSWRLSTPSAGAVQRRAVRATAAATKLASASRSPWVTQAAAREPVGGRPGAGCSSRVGAVLVTAGPSACEAIRPPPRSNRPSMLAAASASRS